MPFAALRKRLTLSRLGVLAAVVTLGLSQILFRLISENAAEFPEQARFHLGILAWVWVFPLAGLLILDLLLVRDDEASGGLAHGWRAALYTLTALSFARQLQATYATGSLEGFDTLTRRLFLALLIVLVWTCLYRARFRLHRYFGALGILALLLVGRYAWAVGLWGPAWRSHESAVDLAGDPSKPPVFVLLFDELSFDVVAGPDGRPERTLFPHLAALADESRWYTNATTNAGLTADVTRILMSGDPRTSDAGSSLFERLPPGYVAEATVAWPSVARWMRGQQAANPRFLLRNRATSYLPDFLELPGQVVHGLAHSPIVEGRGFARGSYVIPGEWVRRDADDRLRVEKDALLAAARSPRARGRVFHWHSSLPHFPFHFDERGRFHGEPEDSFLGSSKPFDAVMSNYRRQARTTDLILGDFLKALKDAGLYEEAIIVLTSDHGLRTWHSRVPQANDRVARIPLLIKKPGLAPGVSDVDYQHIDFLPTVLDLLGAPPGTGVSALASDRPPREKWFRWGSVMWRRAATGGPWSLKKP